MPFWGPLSSKANPLYVGSESPPAIPPLSDLAEDSKEEQELVILPTASTADWHVLPAISHSGMRQGNFPSSSAVKVPLCLSFQASLLVPPWLVL